MGGIAQHLLLTPQYYIELIWPYWPSISLQLKKQQQHLATLGATTIYFLHTSNTIEPIYIWGEVEIKCNDTKFFIPCSSNIQEAIFHSTKNVGIKAIW